MIIEGSGEPDVPTAIAVTGADLVLPPTDPQTPPAAVLPGPGTRPLDAAVADLRALTERHGHVVVVCPGSVPPATAQRLHAVRSLLESDRIAIVRTDLPPLGTAVLVRQLRQLSVCDFSPGVLASAARLLAHYVYAGAVLGSVAKLDHVPVGLGSHVKGWLPGAHFAVLAGPEPQLVRLGSGGSSGSSGSGRSGRSGGAGGAGGSGAGSRETLTGPEFTTDLVLARGQLATDWPTTTLAPGWRVRAVQEAALPESSPGWWGTGKLVEFAAYLPDLPVLHQLVSSVRRETCHWCRMELIGDRCGFCAAPLPTADPTPAPASASR